MILVPAQSGQSGISACILVSKVTKLQVSEAGSINRVEVQVARMVVVMVLAFLVTWLPYAAMALVVIIDSSVYIDPIIATIPVFLAKSSTVYNPIIYIFMNRQVILQFTQSQTSNLRGLTMCAMCVCECSFEDMLFTLSCVDGSHGSQNS